MYRSRAVIHRTPLSVDYQWTSSIRLYGHARHARTPHTPPASAAAAQEVSQLKKQLAAQAQEMAMLKAQLVPRPHTITVEGKVEEVEGDLVPIDNPLYNKYTEGIAKKVRNDLIVTTTPIPITRVSTGCGEV